MKSVAAKSNPPVRNHVGFTLPPIDKEIDNLDVQVIFFKKIKKKLKIVKRSMK